MSTGSASNIIIRLQNLPNEARAIDIRRFFTGLSIPDGGVHVGKCICLKKNNSAFNI
jgi:hypothetical protein